MSVPMAQAEDGLKDGVMDARAGADGRRDDQVERNNVIDPPDILTISMPLAALPSFPDLALHSPSNIIGTPFTTTSAPYEYPFPESPTDTDSGVLPSSSSFSQAPSFASSPPRLTHFPPDLPHNYSPTHPKLRPANPPVPPSLAKKRQQWSLGILRRRSSGNGSASDDGSSSSGLLSSPETEVTRAISDRVASPIQESHTTQEVVGSLNSQHQRKTITQKGGLLG